MEDRTRYGALVSTCGRCQGAFVTHEAFLAAKGEAGAPEEGFDSDLNAALEGEPGETPCPTGDHGRLVSVHLRDVEIDRCPACRGLFFDRGELEALVRREPRLADIDWTPSRRGSEPGITVASIVTDILLGSVWRLTR